MSGEDLQQLLPAAVFVIVMVGLFWWIVVKPAKQREQKHKELIQSIVPGEKVVTVGGVYGKIMRVREDTFELEVSKGVTLTFDRRAVRRRQDEGDD
jgi:preprotein translocase subunit YajC